MSNLKREKAAHRAMTHAELLERIEHVSKLDSWSSYIEEIKVPQDMLPALLTNRPELLKLIQPRALTIEEAATIYKLVATLIETNMALKEHAELVAQMLDNMMGGFTAIQATAKRIDNF